MKKHDVRAASAHGVGADAGAEANPSIRLAPRHSHHFKVEAYRDGKLLWTDEFDNLVVNVGLNEILDKFYKGSTYTASHFVGVTGATPSFAAADTMATHGGWTEETTYSNATRPAFTPGTVSGQSVDNSASKAVFNINGSATFGGAFLTTDNTKGGTSGILIGGNAFTGGNRSLQSGDTLNVTVTATASSS